jgi:hypothetical protein
MAGRDSTRMWTRDVDGPWKKKRSRIREKYARVLFDVRLDIDASSSHDATTQ